MKSTASATLILLPIVLSAGRLKDSLWTHENSDEKSLQALREMKCLIQVNQPCHSMEYIKFYVYSRGKKKEELLLKEKFPPESYDPSANLKVLIHGYSSLGFMRDILQGYLERGTDSILMVDWERLARKPCYLSAKMNTRQVGRCTGEALALLRPRGELHLVGFSLGAHVAGIVSAFLAAQHGIRVDRITGLDPALPLYATPLVEMKLDKSDAAFVDVIHSDPGIYGKAEPSGHVDFYVNGASIQPGCFNVTNPPLCSHRRAAEVFAESINSKKGFWGVKCPSLFHYLSGYCRHIRNSTQRTLMGENADPNIGGNTTITRTLGKPNEPINPREVMETHQMSQPEKMWCLDISCEVWWCQLQKMSFIDYLWVCVQGEFLNLSSLVVFVHDTSSRTTALQEASINAKLLAV